MNRLFLTAVAFSISIAATATDLDSLCYSVALDIPAIKAERARLEAEMLQNSIDNSLAGPEADFDYKFAAPEGVRNRWGVSVGQNFDWPGVYSARAKSNTLRAGAFAQLQRQNVLDKALELKVAAIRLGLARTNLAIIREAHANFKTLLDKTRRAYERGEATILAMRKAELQFMAVATSLADAETEVKQAEAVIEAVNPGVLEAFGCVTAIEVRPLLARNDYAASMSLPTGVKQAWADVARNDIAVAKRSVLPSFKLAYLHDFEDGAHFNGFSVGISLPTWQPKKAVRLATAKAVAADFELTDYRIAIDAQMAADYAQAQRLYSCISEQRIVLADDYAALLTKAYDSGLFTIFEYLTEYNSYLEIMAAHNALVARYAEIEARLSKYLTANQLYDR